MKPVDLLTLNDRRPPVRTPLTDWQLALLRSIWRRPSLWMDGHQDVRELSRRGLIRRYERYLFLTEAGLTVLRQTDANDEALNTPERHE